MLGFQHYHRQHSSSTSFAVPFGCGRMRISKTMMIAVCAIGKTPL